MKTYILLFLMLWFGFTLFGQNQQNIIDWIEIKTNIDIKKMEKRLLCNKY